MHYNVLVADDDEEDFMLLVDHVKQCHQDVTLSYVPNGEGVIKKLQAGTLPDLIILDAKMPLMTGQETMTAIYAWPAWQHIPVIVWSGLVSGPDILKLHQAGVNSVVLKQNALQHIDVFCKYWLELVELPSTQQA